MNERTKTGLEVLQAAVLLGVLGDVLLRQTPWGLNMFLFVSALAAAFVMLVWRHKPEFWNAQTIALNGALVFFGACFLWRDSIELKTFDFLTILVILAILTLPALKIKTQIAGVFHYAIGFIWSGINAAFAPFFLLFDDIAWKVLPQTGWSKHLISILRGLAIAAPLVLIFGALFMAADAVFENLVQKTLNIDPEVLFTHAIFTAFLSWITAGYLRGALLKGFSEKTAENLSITPQDEEIKAQVSSVTEIKDEDVPKTDEKPAEEKEKWSWQNLNNSFLPQFFTLGAVEISVVLGLVNLLFLSFVIIQIQYLFGGFEFVQNTPDFKLAEYARRGFGELVAVAALVLPILLVSHWLLRKDSPAGEKIYRVLAGINIALLFVIMASAMQRLFILTGNLGYGLTTIRFYPMIFMIWLAIVFVLFAATVLRGARQNFAWSALWTALFVLGAMHVVSPDDYIARTNVRLMKEGRSFDAYYNANLSNDAVPVLLENLPSMTLEQQCTVKGKLDQKLKDAQAEYDFRNWNFSRWRAQNEILANKQVLNNSNCPNYTRSYEQF